MRSSPRTLCGVLGAVLLAGCDMGAGSSTSSGSSTFAAPGSAAAAPGSSAPAGISTATSTTPPAQSVSATASVAGTVSVIAGATQTLTVAFTSANGLPVAGLALSGTTLAKDWSGPADFTCTATDTGSNCVLTLTYAPTTAGTGTLDIGYVYAGDQAEPPGSVLSIPYAATSTNNVLATAAPIGQINAVVGTGNQSVSITFTTDDGSAATGLTLTGPAPLPAGWSTTPGFSCAIISNGSGCQLVLDYAPRSAGSGTLTLSYGYTDGSGAARTGAINLPYSSTVDGSVVATVSPAGQINAIQKTGAQAVTVTFNTDDGQVASDLVLLSKPASLPAGWSSAGGGFKCGTVSTGHGCQLGLTYAPTALASGTVTLQYAYTSPAGAFTTGSFNIPYAATTSDNVVATAVPSGQVDAVVGESNPNVTVTFTTDDSRTATALQLTTDLVSLPAGWSSTDSVFACAGVAAGSACQLPLTYTPIAAASGNLTLRYTYLDNAGQAKSGSVNVPYRATTDDTVGATVTPSPVTVLTGSSTPITVSFTTDDGNPATSLAVTSGLATLPAGWSDTAATFACPSVDASTGCQLILTYQPILADSGTLSLGFSYTNDAGLMKTGTVQIPYAATVPGP